LKSVSCLEIRFWEVTRISACPWTGTEFADPVKLKRKLDSMCDLTNEATVLTVAGQALPQNQWSLHPLVDGCTPTPSPPNVQ
jgi:hypothetical protein